MKSINLNREKEGILSMVRIDKTTKKVFAFLVGALFVGIGIGVFTTELIPAILMILIGGFIIIKSLE